MGGPIEKYPEGSDVVIPPGSEPATTLPTHNIYADPTVGTYRTRLHKAANKMVSDGTDISRPAMGRFENAVRISSLGLKDKFYNNTCVECVKEAENMAGIEGGIPDDIYDNRKFLEVCKGLWI